MDFEQIVNTGDAEDIFLALDGLSEQEQIALIEQLSLEAAFRLWDILNSTANWADASAMDAELNGDTTEVVTDYKEISDEAHKLLKVAAMTDAMNAKAEAEDDTSSPVYVYEKVKEKDYPEILSIFEKYGYGKEEMDDWLSSKLTDIGDQFAELDSYIGNETEDTEDVNGDGDTDVVTADTNGNGEKDTAVVTADSEPEKKEAVKAAKEDLGLDKEDKTSTGKTKGELEDEPKESDVVSDEKKKDMTCSDATQKNIMAALLDHRF